MFHPKSIIRGLVVGLSLLVLTVCVPAIASAQTAGTDTPADSAAVPTTTSIEQTAETAVTSEPTSGPTCTINGKVVDCKEQIEKVKTYAKPLAAGLFVFLVITFVLSTLGFAFWLWMLVHLASNPIKDKVLWVIVLIFGGLIGALVYFFAAKRPFDTEQKTLTTTGPVSHTPAASASPITGDSPTKHI